MSDTDSYKPGDKVALAGIPDAKLREIAIAYLKDNYASYQDAIESNYKAALRAFLN